MGRPLAILTFLLLAAAAAAYISLRRGPDGVPVPRTVLVYVYSSARDSDEDGNVRCSPAGLVPVQRSVGSSAETIADTVQLLLRGGLSEEQRAAGLTTEFPLEGVQLESAVLSAGILTLDIDDPYSRTSGGSCRASILRSQVEATAAQFPEVQQVRILPEELFQP